MRSSSPPILGRCYYDHIEWWRYLASVPAPRIVVVLDADDPPGIGALFGELHARISMAMNSVAYITNGAVRDLPAIEKLGFQIFAGNSSVSHAYAHMVDFGHCRGTRRWNSDRAKSAPLSRDHNRVQSRASCEPTEHVGVLCN